MERYTIEIGDGAEYLWHEIPDPKGPYVKYTDHQQAVEALQRDNRLLLEHITCARKVIEDREQERDALKGQVETFKKAAESSHAGHMDAVHYADILKADLTRLRAALEDIVDMAEHCASELAIVRRAEQALSPAQPGQGGGA